MSSRRYSKAFKRVMIIGLAIILLTVITTRAFTRNKTNLANRLVAYLSRYRKLWPYIAAQAKLETADKTPSGYKPFVSKVYRVDNNMFGMKVATKRNQLGRPGLPASDGGHYQHYWSDSQSLRDLFIYFDYVRFPTAVSSPEQYVRELKSRGYFTSDESTYLLNLKHWMR